MANPPLISLNNISKVFLLQKGRERTSLTALSHLSFDINEGEFLVLLGPSGSGKSTVLRLLNGLDVATEGKITYDPKFQKAGAGFVFQHFALLPWLTVKQNVELGLLKRGASAPAIDRRVSQELKRLGLESFARSYPKELSGGLRQRVGLARALVIDPPIIFMDEPFSELDSFTAEDLRQEILRVWQETKTTIVMVTHLIEEAIALADRIVVLTPRPGKIEKVVVNHLPRPRERRSPAFYQLEDELHRLIRP